MKVRIGCLVDSNMNHYQFARASGLPVDYFKPKRSLARVALTTVTVLLAVGLLAAFFTVH